MKKPNESSQVLQAQEKLSKLQMKQRELEDQVETAKKESGGGDTSARAEQFLKTGDMPAQSKPDLDSLYDSLRVTRKAVELQRREVENARCDAATKLCKQVEPRVKKLVQGAVESAVALGRAIDEMEDFVSALGLGVSKPAHWTMRILKQHTGGLKDNGDRPLNAFLVWAKEYWKIEVK
jgi:hypothetical protein